MAELMTQSGSGVGLGDMLVSSTQGGLWAIQTSREKGGSLVGKLRHLPSFGMLYILLLLIGPRGLEH